ncbi:ABC transporter substrate-binding protein [Haloquadratum walsbyi]|uniref:ABC-type nitrate/sulfonate/bicarbonate transport system, periplasmic component n=1 Tax=Haloquadratum walsbyi J07HQW2 TaxID=1238425 RepID=U1PTE0_9EURY|nr:ABC transporter substrate-binding protein [Haloquadratum walsbyi]ERG97067.1 MAG: ABC-type nitrate/sulfonate/bicarbonate transport system, periplasmic component [Haloquadratum walsbyi J07HQW2]
MYISRRRALKSASVTAAVAVSGCLGESISGTDSSKTIAVREVESSVSAAVFRWGIENGVWSSRNLELDFQTVPYGRYNRQLVTDESDIGAPATVAQMEFMTDGEPLTFIGPQQNMFNRMFVRADDSSIEDPTDLVDKRLGVPAAVSSTTTIVHRALIDETHGIDIIEDTAETRAEDPPVLWELLQDGELDAISEFSGYTIRGIADESTRTIFDPHAIWTERTGVGLPTTTFTVRQDWFDENRDITERFLQGWGESVSLFRSDAETALNQFGRAAGISDPDEAAVVGELMDNDTVFGPPFYEESLADSHWSFFELLADRQVLDLPDRDTAITTADAFDQG